MVSGPRDRNLTDDEGLALFAHLLSKYVNSKLPYGSIKAAAEELNVQTRTATRISKARLDANDKVGGMNAIRNRKKGRVGRPSIYAKIVNDAFVSVPARHTRRCTIRPQRLDFRFKLLALAKAWKNRTCEHQDETTSYRGEQNLPSKVGAFDDFPQT